MKTDEKSPIPENKIPETVRSAQLARDPDDMDEWLAAVFGRPADQKAVERFDEAFRG